jgi:serine/threonine-protein kinase ATR
MEIMAGDEEPKPQGLHLENGNGTPSSVLNSLLPSRVSQEAFSTISQLRTELLEKGPASSSRGPEDVKNTQTLISVALDVAFKVTPVADQPRGVETEKRLLDCVDIIQLLIESSARVLGGDLETQVSSQDAPLPFYVRLIIGLIELGLKVRLNTVEAKVKAILIMITRFQHDMFRSTLFPRNSVSILLSTIATGKLIFLYHD